MATLTSRVPAFPSAPFPLTPSVSFLTQGTPVPSSMMYSVGSVAVVEASSHAGRWGVSRRSSGNSCACNARRPAASSRRRKVGTDIVTPRKSFSMDAPSANEPAMTPARCTASPRAAVIPSRTSRASSSG